MTFFEFLHTHRFKILGTVCFVGGFILAKDLTIAYVVSQHLQVRQAAFKKESEAFDDTFKKRWKTMDESFKSQSEAWDNLKAEREAIRRERDAIRREKEALRRKEEAQPKETSSPQETPLLQGETFEDRVKSFDAHFKKRQSALEEIFRDQGTEWDKRRADFEKKKASFDESFKGGRDSIKRSLNRGGFPSFEKSPKKTESHREQQTASSSKNAVEENLNKTNTRNN